jgi:hypothetical protein
VWQGRVDAQADDEQYNPDGKESQTLGLVTVRLRVAFAVQLGHAHGVRPGAAHPAVAVGVVRLQGQHGGIAFGSSDCFPGKELARSAGA